jgi:hypothetical protein
MSRLVGGFAFAGRAADADLAERSEVNLIEERQARDGAMQRRKGAEAMETTTYRD